MGIWDEGDVDSTHSDFGARVTEVDNVGESNHSTHVAGTVGGDGALSSGDYKGMAPGVNIYSYDWNSNLTEHNGAISSYGIEISQNSWGYDINGPNPYGAYAYDAPEYDQIVRGLYGKQLVVVFSAGNEQPIGGNKYDRITPPATAKNMITVGAINSDDFSMTSFSSFGPTDDGRIKPDLVAPGSQTGGDLGVTSTLPGNAYGTYSGTSMAAPTVSGVGALLIEQYRNTYVGDPLPSTVKGVLIQTARDLGNAGPDYKYGYGGIDALAAVDLIGKGANIYEGSLSQGGSYSQAVSVPSGGARLKATLVWSDKEGTANASPALVNNLDLAVTAPDNSTYLPWVLGPIKPLNIGHHRR